MRTILFTMALMVSVGNAMARSQIIIMPDGSQMVCYYYNDGKIVYCEKL